MTVIVNKPAPINLREELSALKKPTGLFGEEILKTNDVNDFYQATGSIGRKNLLINGKMEVNQRGLASHTTDSVYTLDRWKVGRYDSNSVQISRQNSGLDEFPYCMRIQNPSGTASSTEIHMSQVLESRNSNWLKGKPVTLSFWARRSSTATSSSMTATVFYGSGTDEYADYNYFASNPIGGPGAGDGLGININLNTYWTKYTLLSPGRSTTNQIGVALSKNNGSQTAGSNDYIEVTGVQLEQGRVATPFEHRSYAEELSLCQRYYERVTAVSNTAWMTGYGFGTTLYFYLPWKTTKRTNDGTATYSNASLNDVLNVYGTGSSSADVAGLYSSFATGSAHSHGLSFYMSLTASTYTPRGTALLWGIKNEQWIASESEL
jgi:hypothetical protein